ncbi:MAG: C25 family cysteine peptidase [Candidatus Hatepunaea meridiana]|nr:C25 family cysteine peptidase [Candidatus Hatepunaea meridiana]
MLNRIITISFIFVLLPIIALSVVGQNVYTQNNGIDVKINRISDNSYRIEYKTDGQAIQFLSEDNVIPVITRWIAIAPSGNLSVRVLDMKTTSQAETTAPLRTDPVTIGSKWSSNGIDFIPITFNPIVSAKDGKQQFIQQTKIEININGSPPDLSRLGYEARKMWGDLLINRDDPRRDDGDENFASTYIYIKPANDRVGEIIQPLVELRRLEGYNVVEMNHFGNPEWVMESIRNMNDEGQYPVEYICLVGDVGGEFSVPTFIRGTSDYPYGLLNGVDPLPEAAVGRISYNSLQELEDIIDKIITYETEPDVEEDDWYYRGAVCAGSERSGFSTILVGRWVRDLMLRNNYTEVDTFWWNMGGGVGNFMQDVFNRGALFINYRGWTGMEDWSRHDVLRLRNQQLPVALLLACNAGDFNGQGFGYTEALLRAEGGAIGAIGTVGFQSRVDFNNALLAGYYRGVIEGDVCRLGWSLNRAKLELFATYSYASMERVSDHAYWTNLMGDPGTVIWRGVPREVELELPEVVNIGDGEFTVVVTDEDENPVPGVRVGFLKLDEQNEQVEFVSAAYTDENGEAQVVIDLDMVTPGTGSVTVSGDRVIPHTEELRFQQSDHIIAYDNHFIIDDNMQPRVGNGDGITNPGEIIGLTVTVRNDGIETIEGGVEFTLTTDHNACEVLEGEYRYEGDIQSNGRAESNFLIRLGMNFPDRETVPLTITAVHNDDEWNLEFGISGAAPRWEALEIFVGDDVEPGAEWLSISLDLTNTGQLDIEGTFIVELISLNDYTEVLNNIVEYADPLPVEDTLFAESDFIIALDEFTPYDISLLFEFQFFSEDEYEAVIPFSLQVVGRPFDVPAGPDEYGYWAIDNRDRWISNIAPNFNWTEINPRRNGPGTDTEMIDRGEDDDKSVVLQLPFDFQYYGEEYDRLTVCTNGWAAFGDQGNYVDFRNLPIGSPQGPIAQLCPWWDDLYQPTPSSGVYYYFDEAQHRFIVEWYYMRRWIGPAGPGAPETFQLILLDPLWHPTYTGDGDIIFQYLNVVNEGRIDAHGTPYATFGIGDPDDQGGLQYGFWNRWAPGASAIGNGSVIRFATSSWHRYSIVYGNVNTAANGDPVPNATVGVIPGGWVTTDENGMFRIPTALADEELQIILRIQGYNDITRDLNPIRIGDSAGVNFELTHPQIDINVDAFVDTLEDNEEADYEFTISNAGDGELSFEIGFGEHEDEFGFCGAGVSPANHPRSVPACRDEPFSHRPLRQVLTPDATQRDDPDEDWDRLASFDVTEQTDDNRILGVIFADEHYYVSGGNNGEMTNYLYRFNRVGRYINRLEQPCRGRWGMHDLAWNSETERLYGGSGRWIYSMNLNGADVDSIPSPLFPPRALAVNSENGDLWVSNEGSPIYRLDSEGNVLDMFSHRLRPYGFAWRSDDPDDYPLYIFSADGETGLEVCKFSPETGEFMHLAQLEPVQDGDISGGCYLTTGWSGTSWTLIAVIQNPEGDRVDFYDAGLNLSWISVEPESGEVNAEGEQECVLTISTTGLEGGEYAVDLVITHNADEGEMRIPVFLMHDSQFAGVSDDSPFTYRLNAVYPNPTNGIGMITFHLPTAGQVALTIIDQTGRRIRSLTESRFTAGSHRLTFGVNELPSGIYFIQMMAAREVRTRKFVLLK